MWLTLHFENRAMAGGEREKGVAGAQRSGHLTKGPVYNWDGFEYVLETLTIAIVSVSRFYFIPDEHQVVTSSHENLSGSC